MTTCGDCAVSEGEFHKPGCDMEICPFCGGQLISCGCAYKIPGIDISPGTYAYENGLTEELEKQWDELLKKKGLVPYIQWPNICAKCGKLWPDMFRVKDEEWKKYIDISHQDQMLCRSCYEYIKNVIDNAVED
jgi:hypothetical protein